MIREYTLTVCQKGTGKIFQIRTYQESITDARKRFLRLMANTPMGEPKKLQDSILITKSRG